MAETESVQKGRITFFDHVKRPQLVLFYASLVLIVLACLPQFKYLFIEYWFLEDWFSKGPIIWVFSLFVIHRNLPQGEFKKTTTRHDLSFTAAFVPVLGLSLYIDPLIAPTLLVIVAWYLVSPTINFTQLFIVWLFLVLSLPYYSHSVYVLQWLTVVVTENLLGILGIPALVQEFYIAIPNGQFFVELGCSGLHEMTNNLLLFFIYCLLNKFNMRQFLLGLLVAVSLALVANWVRVVSIILFAHNFGVDHDFVGDHANFGWFLYVMFLFPFFYFMVKIDSKYRREIVSYQPVQKGVLAAPAGILLSPFLVIVFLHQVLFMA